MEMSLAGLLHLPGRTFEDMMENFYKSFELRNAGK